MKIAVMMIILLSAVNLMAFKIADNPRIDKYSPYHFAFGYIGTDLCLESGMTECQSFLTCFTVEILWETYVDGLNNPMFGLQADPRGFGLDDVFVFTAGAALKLMLHNEKQIYIGNKRIAIQYKLR